jgi:D-amino peptidase
MAFKAYISVDMEGISGLVHRDHVGRDGKDYEASRRLMTLEANAAIEGAFEGGANEVVVNDSHGTQRNLLPELLDPRAQVITGSPKPQSMMAGLDDSFGAVLCVGYHARAGSQGILDHTISSQAVYDIKINGDSQGEMGLNAGIAAYHGVPIVLLTGDSTATAQAVELVPEIEVATVKESLTRYAAKNLSPSASQELIRQQSKLAVERREEIAPVQYEMPVTLTLQFMFSAMADVAELVPGVQRLDPLTVSYTSGDYLEAWHCIRALILMAGAVA